jgi:hypothetical protein
MSVRIRVQPSLPIERTIEGRPECAGRTETPRSQHREEQGEGTMSSHTQPVPTKHFVTKPDKKNKNTRIARGGKIVAQSATSTIVQGNADFLSAAKDVGAATDDLKNKVDAENKAAIAHKAARSALRISGITWDTKYSVYTSVASKYITNEQEAHDAGIDMRGQTTNPLAAPVLVELKHRPKQDDLRIHVHRAPGMRAVSTEITNNISDPTSWKELDGDGAVHLVPHPAPGTWWVRARSKTAKATSDYTTPVSVIVK